MVEEQLQKILNKLDELFEKEEKLTLTTKEVSKLLGIGMNKTSELIHSKDYPYIKAGGKNLTIKAMIPDWLENNIGKVF